MATSGAESGDTAKKLVTSVPFCSMIGSGFWHKYSELVLDKVQLSREKIPIWGHYTKSIVPNLFSVDYTSFNATPSKERDSCNTSGFIINTNTVEEFKQIDKSVLIQSEGQQLVDLLSTDEGVKKIENSPRLLVPFFILIFGNLKNYKYKYWFGFPAISSIKIAFVGKQSTASFSELELGKEISLKQDLVSTGFFVIDTSGTELQLKPLEDGEIGSEKYYAFFDSSSVKGCPSWGLRNFTAYIVAKHKLKSHEVLNVVGVSRCRSKIESHVYSFRAEFPDDYLSNPKIVGWERNSDGKLVAQDVDLQSSMDPASLSESSVDFNLKLMKWRVFPALDLDKIRNTKCLLFGAGTLGCNVARCLLGWGVRHIKFIDNSSVSYSNPVRQSLFTFEDAVQRKPKAKAAAEALKKIYPGIDSSGETAMVPMPGHPVSAATLDQVTRDFATIKSCVKESDVIFLLMDTREARWLPTVMGAAENKIVINAALGFDSYVVMQHGNADNNLGCYFCTDVVAPGDSSRDRTLDQQCTVTRPGVSYIASAYAVELLISILHRELSTPLGLTPHSIRGYLSSGELLMPSFAAFDKCTACSPVILEEYKKRHLDFVTEIMNNPQDLEVISGLDKLKVDDAIEGIVELTDDDDD